MPALRRLQVRRPGTTVVSRGAAGAWELAPPPPAGRPGRRSAEVRRWAVLELLSGHAGVEEISRRAAVRPATLERWCTDAMLVMSEVLRGGRKPAHQVALERENARLRRAMADLSVQLHLLRSALGAGCPRPSWPATSPG